MLLADAIVKAQSTFGESVTADLCRLMIARGRRWSYRLVSWLKTAGSHPAHDREAQARVGRKRWNQHTALQARNRYRAGGAGCRGGSAGHAGARQARGCGVSQQCVVSRRRAEVGHHYRVGSALPGSKGAHAIGFGNREVCGCEHHHCVCARIVGSAGAAFSSTRHGNAVGKSAGVGCADCQRKRGVTAAGRQHVQPCAGNGGQYTGPARA